MSGNRLSRQEWNTLDTLLGKHGFGGYYDLVECLRTVANQLGVGNSGVDTEEVKNLPEIVALLQTWSLKLSLQDAFLTLVLKMEDK